MAYQFPGMAGVGPNYMPQMNQPYPQGYPGMQPAGSPFFAGAAPGFQGGAGPAAFGGQRNLPVQVPAFNQYGQGMAPLQQRPMQGRGGRPGSLVSRMAGQQQSPAGLPGQMPIQYPQVPQGFQQPGRQAKGIFSKMGQGRPMGGAQAQPGMQMPSFQGRGMQGPAAGQMMQPMQQPMMQSMQQPGVSPMGKQIKPKQFVLSAVGGVSGGSGVATIPDGNNLSLVANNLPDPSTMNPGQNLAYVAYLTNRKGQGAFALGPLTPIGGGTYRLNFNSNVPFYDYDQVVVSLENPFTLRNSPTGQVVLASTGGAGISLPKPVRKFFGGLWGKIKGAGQGISNKIGGGKKTPEPQMSEPNTNFQNLFNNYTLGPSLPPTVNNAVELPGLGTFGGSAPTEAPPTGENP